MQLYFSTSKSLAFEKGLEGDFNEGKNKLAIITEKKAYSSYVGGIYVYRNSQLERNYRTIILHSGHSEFAEKRICLFNLIEPSKSKLDGVKI